MGSRAEGRATKRSDYDFLIEASDFAHVAEALSDLLAVLGPLAQQWDRLSDRMCWMVMLPGAVKIDLIFSDAPHEREPPWKPSRETLDAIDAHFWDWMLWLRSKEAKGDTAVLNRELRRLHEHLLSPLGEQEPPSSIAQAVANYRRNRDEAERRFGCSVDRSLEAVVAPVLR